MNALPSPLPQDLPTASTRPRLNPFGFPSNTDFFFALLVFAVLAVSLEIFNMIYLWNDATGMPYINGLAACVRRYSLDNLAINTKEFSSITDAYIGCIIPVERQRAAWMAAGLLPELALAGLVYWLYPAWIIRRGRLTPLTRDEFPALVDAVTQLSREIGLARVPALYWNPLDMTVGGMAFGRAGRYSVKLTGGLASQFFAAPERFNAVMLHELAHIRSADIDKTYLTMAFWIAFVLATLAPFSYFLLQSDPGLVLDIAWRIALLGLLVYLIRNAVLRSREYYADLRASQQPAVRASLKSLLAELRPPDSRLSFHRANALLALHPRPEQRLHLLDDTLPLFQQSFLTALTTGLVLGIGYEPMMSFLVATGLSNLQPAGFPDGLCCRPAGARDCRAGRMAQRFCAPVRIRLSRYAAVRLRWGWRWAPSWDEKSHPSG